MTAIALSAPDPSGTLCGNSPHARTRSPPRGRDFCSSRKCLIVGIENLSRLGGVKKVSDIVTTLLSSFVSQLGPRTGIGVAFAFVLGLLAIDRMRTLLSQMVSEPTPQARSKGVTKRMVGRVDFALLMFCLFTFYGMVSTLFSLPGDGPLNRFWDVLINVSLIALIFLPIFFNVGELIDRRTVNIDRIIYQLRLLVRRGVNFSSVGTSAIAVAFKYELQGANVIAPVITKVQSVDWLRLLN
jgi:hypothetical protein